VSPVSAQFPHLPNPVLPQPSRQRFSIQIPLLAVVSVPLPSPEFGFPFLSRSGSFPVYFTFPPTCCFFALLACWHELSDRSSFLPRSLPFHPRPTLPDLQTSVTATGFPGLSPLFPPLSSIRNSIPWNFLGFLFDHLFPLSSPYPLFPAFSPFN